MEMKLPIVVCAFERPKSLERLLKSLIIAQYPNGRQIDLIISIDYTKLKKCYSIAKNFEWPYGNKEIIQQTKRLGLRKHIIQCGNIALENDGVIILEDDCFVSKDFYKYSLKVIDFYKSDPKIAGLSLYSYSFNENASMPFNPLFDGHDIYFMQIPSSLGQIWTKHQWSSFIDYYANNPELSYKDQLPLNVINWPETSWKKIFYKYMVEKDLFFVYPHNSHTTNFGDPGTHTSFPVQLWQVPLCSTLNNELKLVPFFKSFNKYDAYFELLPDCLKNFGFLFEKTVLIDTYLTKQQHLINSEYVLTTYPSKNYIMSFDISMQPLLNNLLYKNYGTGLFLVPTTYYSKSPYSNLLQIREKCFGGTYFKGYEDGITKIKRSKSYKIGKSVTTLLDVKKWINRY